VCDLISINNAVKPKLNCIQ